jgi:uncharacterized LabA/DUF88 family protein
VDRSKLYIYLKEKHSLDVIYYAVWYIPHKLHLYQELQKMWYTMLYKNVSFLPDGSIKWNVDIDIAIQAIFDLTSHRISHWYLMTNDGDYNTLIEVFQKHTMWWKLFTPDIKTASKMIKNLAGQTIDLQDIKERIQKNPTVQ